MYTIDTRTNAIVRSVALGQEASALAVDGATGTVYATTDRGNIVEIEHQTAGVIAHSLKPYGVLPFGGHVVVADNFDRTVSLIQNTPNIQRT